MAPETFNRSILRFVRRQPFRPFRIHLVDGGVLEVHHPEALAVNGGFAALIERDGGASLFEADTVARIEGPRASNGRASREPAA